MKVFDIITESRRQLTESMIVFGRMLAYAISKGGAGLEHALSYIAKSVLGKPNAAKELAEAWILTAEKAGMSTSEAISLGSNAARGARVADDVIVAAEREAAELVAQGRGVKIWTKLKTKTDQAEFFWGAGWAAVNKGLMYWGIGKPIFDAVSGILNIYKLRDEGHPELQDQAKLQWAVQWYIDDCVAKVAALLAGRAVIKGVLGPNGIQQVPLLNFSAFNKLYNLASPATQAAFAAWMITPAGHEALAKWLVGEAMMPGTDWKIPGGAMFKGLVVKPLGALVISGNNAFLRMIGSDKAKPLPPKDTNEPAKAPRKSSFDLGTGRPINPVN